MDSVRRRSNEYGKCEGLHSHHNVVTLSPHGELHSTIQQSGGTTSTINEVVHQLQAQRKQSEQQLEKLNLAIRARTRPI
jgi:hypothetical protein